MTRHPFRFYCVLLTLLCSACCFGQKGNKSGQQSSSSPSSGQGGQGGSPFFETQMLAYGSINEIAYGVAQRVCQLDPFVNPSTPQTIIIFDPISFQNLQAWQSFEENASMLEGAYATLLKPKGPEALADTAAQDAQDTRDDLAKVSSEIAEKENQLNTPPQPGALSVDREKLMLDLNANRVLKSRLEQAVKTKDQVAAQLKAESLITTPASLGDVASAIGALSASSTNTASPFTIPDSAMAVSLSHQFMRLCAAGGTKNKVKIKYYPLFGSAPKLSDATASLNAVLGSLNAVRSKIQQDVLSGKATSTMGIGPPTSGGTPGTTSNALTDLLKDLNTQYDALMATLTTSVAQNQTQTQAQNPTAPAGTGLGTTSILQGAIVESDLKDENTYVLFANVVAAGGTQFDYKNALTVLFLGDIITYSGGAVADVALTKSTDDSLLLADTVRYRTQFHRLHHPDGRADNVDGENAGANLYSLCNSEERHSYFGFLFGGWLFGGHQCPSLKVVKPPKDNGDQSKVSSGQGSK